MANKNKADNFQEPPLFEEIAAPVLKRDDFSLFFRWINLIRMLTIFTVIALIVILAVLSKLTFDPLLVFILLFIFQSLIAFFWVIGKKRFDHSFTFVYGQIVLDVLTITVGLYFIGDVHSDFSLLYILTVVTAGLLSFRALLATLFLVIFCYSALAGLIPLGNLPGLRAFQFAAYYDLSRMVIFIFVLGVIAFQSRYYLSQINKKDKELLKLKDELLFTTVHDLRSPASSIRWTLEKYRQNDLPKKHPQLKEDFELLKQLIGRIINLVNQMMRLATSQSTERALPCRPVYIKEVVKKALEEEEVLFKEKKITKEYQALAEDVLVLSNEEALQEVFSNLVNNAFKYNKEGGIVKISHQIKGRFLETTVEDSGQGISAENLPMVFTPYFREDQVRHIEGTGLGLYIVKKLVEKMNGRIAVYSQLGKGAVFKVTLPIVDDFSKKSL